MKRQSTKSHLWIFLLIQSESKKCQNEMIQHSFSNVSRDLKIDWLRPTLKCDPNFTNKTFLFGHLIRFCCHFCVPEPEGQFV